MYGADAFVAPLSLRNPTSTKTTTTSLYHNNNKNKKKSSASGGKGFGGSSSSSSSRAGVTPNMKTMDRFPYAGALRPGRQSPQRVVAVDSNIVQPDYAATGIPQRNDKPMFPWMIEVKNAVDIEKMRAAGSLARDILDLAGQAVQVGVTTDEIDALVHNEIIKVRRHGGTYSWREQERRSSLVCNQLLRRLWNLSTLVLRLALTLCYTMLLKPITYPLAWCYFECIIIHVSAEPIPPRSIITAFPKVAAPVSTR